MEILSELKVVKNKTKPEERTISQEPWMHPLSRFVRILDWALHVGEATPQQDKALELLGFELPYPNKPKSKFNNCKTVFDAVCKNKFLELCKGYGTSHDTTQC